jgi:hypothetical protein
MAWIGAVLCALATLRLRTTPLAATALATTIVNVVSLLAAALITRREGQAPRAAVALGHVSGALGAFFLVVSFLAG